jgi:hypothetical protein
LRDNVCMGTNDRSRVVLVAIGTVVAVLIGVAVVIALQPPPVLDLATPQGTAQGYFQALHDGDDDLVASYLTADLKARCDDASHLEEVRRYEQHDATSVSIVSTEIDGNEAEVEVMITVTYGEGPFDAGSDAFKETLVMEHHGDRWLISEPTWPWDRYSCEREG